MSAAKRNTRRETAAEVRERGQFRKIIITIEAGSSLIGLRPKGLRQTEYLDAAYIWQHAVKLRVAAEAIEKKKAKKKK